MGATVLTAALTLAAALWLTPTGEPAINGRATYYSPGLMEQVASNRGMNLADYAGGVALNRRADLGRTVWIIHDGKEYGPFKVIDCARQGADFEERERRGLVVEVSWQQGVEWHMLGPVPVRVLFAAPEPEGAF